MIAPSDKPHHERLAAILTKLSRHPEKLENWLLDGEDRVERLKQRKGH